MVIMMVMKPKFNSRGNETGVIEKNVESHNMHS